MTEYLRVPWTARRSNQSILQEVSPGCSLEGLMLKLKLWPPDAKSWLIRKDPDAGKDWGQEEKGTTENEMVGWHHQLNGRGCGWTPGVSDGQGGLTCCSSWGHKELDTTERLNWTEYSSVCVCVCVLHYRQILYHLSHQGSLICVYIHTYYIFFIDSSVYRHLICFHVSAIVYSGTTNTGVNVSFQSMVFSRYMLQSGWYDNYIFSFLRSLPMVFHNGCINLHSYQ